MARPRLSPCGCSSATARRSDAAHFIDIDPRACRRLPLHGAVSLDFVEQLAELGGQGTRADDPQCRLGRPDSSRAFSRGSRTGRGGARRLMRAARSARLHADLYLRALSDALPAAFGEQIAWAESNAIVFANSVIGARTDALRRFHRPCRGDHRPRPLCRPACAREPARQDSLQAAAGAAERWSTPTLGGRGRPRHWRAIGALIPVIVGLPADFRKTI